MMPNVLAFPVAFFGVLVGGFVATPINPLYTPRELIHQVNDSGAKVLVVLDEFVDVVAEARPHLGVATILVSSEGPPNFPIKHAITRWADIGAIPFSHALEPNGGRPPRDVQLASTDLAVLQYTGGTTGVSKGAMLTHGTIAANTEMMRLWLSGPVSRCETAHPVMVSALPLYHIYALSCCCIFASRVGARSILIRDARDIGALIDRVRNVQFNIIWGVNTLYAAIIDHPDAGKIDFSKLTLSLGGGSAMQAPTAKAWVKLSGVPIVQGYGMSETSPTISINRTDDTEFNGAVGYPLPSTEISLRDNDGNAVPLGEIGEVCIRAPTVMAGYWRRPEETAACFTADGFFKSGDLATMSPKGLLSIVDRKKDIIFVSGFNVYPNELEDVIAAHPKVREVAIVGRPDERSGERVVAHIVPADDTLTSEELVAFCRQQMTAYKIPREVVLRASLPKSTVGKVLRRELRDEARSVTHADASQLPMI